MTFREFNLSMMKNPVLGKLLPLECRRTYPRLELEGGTLCASFVGFRAKPVSGGLEAHGPAYYLKITYPQCMVRSFVKFSADPRDGRLMTPRTPESIKALAESCDKVLEAYDGKAEDLERLTAEYNALLDQILEPEQLAALDKMARL